MRNDTIIESYELMVLREHISVIGLKNLPVADISHHHSKLNEEMIDKWLNKGKSYDDPETHGADIENKKKLHHVISDTSDKFSHLANEHVRNLNLDHYKSVSAYVTGCLDGTDTTGSSHVNNHLIDSHKKGIEPTSHFKFGSDDDFQQELHIHHLDDAINQNTHHEKFTTYSGIGFNPENLMQGKGIIHLPAYTSSSTNKETALVYAKPDEDYEHHILQITHPKGSKGLYMGDNEDVTPFGQKEHLMPRNTTIKVNPVPERYHDVNGTRINVWKALRLKDKK